VGLGLWYFPTISFLVEVLLVVIGFFYLYFGTHRSKKDLVLAVLIIFAFSVMLFAPEPEVIQSDMKIRALVVLVSYLIFYALAYWSEFPSRKRIP